VFVAEYFDGPPLAGKNQFWVAIAGKVAPDYPTDESNILQYALVGFVDREAIALLLKQTRCGGLWVHAGQESSADKNVQVAITIVVRNGQWADGTLIWCNVANRGSCELVGTDDFPTQDGNGVRSFVSRHSAEQRAASVGSSPSGEAGQIIRQERG
jgi:hypothetical protein